jgi:hypothetical protein
MRARLFFLTAGLAAAALMVALVGCASRGTFNSGQRAPWRGQVERACLTGGTVQASTYVRPMSEIDGPGVCGLMEPLRVSGLAGGRVTVTPAATIGCPMTAALDRWVRNSVQPASYRYFGRPVVEIKQIASFGCRGRNSNRFGAPSEHAFGNALDVAGFRLAGGDLITVVRGWKGSPRERAFLQAVFSGACSEFYTVLGPGSDRYHYNHFHLDLLLTNTKNGHHLCQSSPARGLPVAGGNSGGTAWSNPLSLAGRGAN